MPPTEPVGTVIKIEVLVHDRIVGALCPVEPVKNTLPFKAAWVAPKLSPLKRTSRPAQAPVGSAAPVVASEGAGTAVAVGVTVRVGIGVAVANGATVAVAAGTGVAPNAGRTLKPESAQARAPSV